MTDGNDKSGSIMNTLAAAAEQEGVAGSNGENMGPVVSEVPMNPALTNEMTEAQIPLRKKGKQATVPRGAVAAAKVLPDPQRIVIKKRTADGGLAAVGRPYKAQEIATGGGDVESFIGNHLRAYLDKGLNTFRVYMSNAKNELEDHGEIQVYGDPEAPTQGNPGTPYAPTGNPIDDSMKMFEAVQRMQQQSEERARRDAAEREERDRKMTEAIAAMQNKQSGGGLSDLMGMMMVMRQMQPQAPPAPDAMQQAAVLKSLIGDTIGPIVQQIGDLRHRVEAVSMQPPPPPPPAPDPFEAVAKIIDAVKPAAPPPPAEPPMRLQDLILMMDKLKPAEQFTIRDLLAMQERTQLQMDRLVERQEAREQRMLEKQTPARGIKDTLEEVKLLKEAGDLIAGNVGDQGLFDKLTNPDFIGRATQFFAMIKGEGGGEDDEDDESSTPTIEVKETTPQPSADDMARGAYPAGFDEVIGKLSTVAAEDPKDEATAKKILVTMIRSLQWLGTNDEAWRKPIFTMLAAAASDDEKVVIEYVGAYLRGLAKHGKLALPVAERIGGVFVPNVKVAIALVKSKMPGAPKAK